MICAKEYCLNGHQCKKYQWEILHSFFIFSKNLKKLFIYLFIYFWLCWIFGCLWAFSSYSTRASHCSGFSCCRAQALDLGTCSCGA